MNVGLAVKALLDEGGVSYRTNSKSYILTCPRCRKREKLYIRRTDGKFVCWICKETDNFSGAAEWCLAELLPLPVSEIRKSLYGDQEMGSSLYLDLKLTDFFDENDELPLGLVEEPEVDLDPGFRDLDSPAGKDGLAYLESRGISLEIAKQYSIVYWPAKHRIVFPVIAKGRLLGWQDRYVGPTEYFDEETQTPVRIPKALTSMGLKRDRVLLFGDRITADFAILTEGPFDALKAHLCGGNVATMGKAVSKQQLMLLRNSGIRKLYLALDPDAFLESARILRELADDLEIYDMRPPSNYEDLGAMPMEEVRSLQLQAPRVDRNYLFLYLKNHYE